MALNRVCEAGRLLGVDVFRLEGDSKFVTAVRFRFERDVVTFLTVAEDDTVIAQCGPFELDDDGEWVDVSNQPVWSECVGGHVVWAWQLTNQQGYTDAIRIEFEMAGRSESRIVEMVVVASAFDLFVAREM